MFEVKGGMVAQSDHNNAWMGIGKDNGKPLSLVVAHGEKVWEWTFTDRDVSQLLSVIQAEEKTDA